jgi:hypothetical protein
MATGMVTASRALWRPIRSVREIKFGDLWLALIEAKV